MTRPTARSLILIAVGPVFAWACQDDPAQAETADDSGPADTGSSSSDETTGATELPPGTPTFYEDVAPLLARHCRSCHTADGIAPFTLDTYEEAQILAPAIATVVASGTMPPWHVGDDGDCNTYRDSRRVPEEDAATLAAWADAGAPAGTPAPIPEPVELPHLDDVAVTLTPAASYVPNDALTDDYRCFIVDPGNIDDRFLTAYEVHPGQPSVVHHVVVFSIDNAEEEAAAADLDASAPGPGYPCYGASGTDGGRSLLVWTPGTGATSYPAGTGVRLVGGHSLVMQVHYFGGGVEDRTTIDLELADTVASEAFITSTFDASVEIPPGEEAHVQSAAVPLPGWDAPMQIHAVYPHMHTYGRTLRVDYDQGQDSRCLVDVPDYDFDWQQFFFYEEPIVLAPPGGGHFRITCTYDSRGATEPIVFGEGTGDEMCIAALYVTY